MYDHGCCSGFLDPCIDMQCKAMSLPFLSTPYVHTSIEIIGLFAHGHLCVSSSNISENNVLSHRLHKWS